MIEQKEKKKDVVVLANMDGTIDGTFECRNRVHSGVGISPTIQTAQFVYVVSYEDKGKQQTWIF